MICSHPVGFVQVQAFLVSTTASISFPEVIDAGRLTAIEVTDVANCVAVTPPIVGNDPPAGAVVVELLDVELEVELEVEVDVEVEDELVFVDVVLEVELDVVLELVEVDVEVELLVLVVVELEVELDVVELDVDVDVVVVVEEVVVLPHVASAPVANVAGSL
jgi:hypothetical protein